MRITNNLYAMNTRRQLSIANAGVSKKIEKLSGGYRINQAGDDAAGLAISEKMRAQIRGLNRASRNVQDGISLVQTAEGALQEIHNALQRMRELSVQAASDTNEQTIDRAALEQEFQQLKREVDDTASKTRFNDQNLIDGTFARAKGGATPYNVPVRPLAAPFSAPLAAAPPAAEGIQPLSGDIRPLAAPVTIDLSTLDSIDPADDRMVNGNGYWVLYGMVTVTAKNAILTGTLKSGLSLRVESDEATLRNATINGRVSMSSFASNAQLTLEGTNTISSAYDGLQFSGINGKNLHIGGSGTLNVTGGNGYAGIGIGGSGPSSTGSLIINSGTINAKGGVGAAAIGGDKGKNGGNLIINGGTVNAVRNGHGAAIGGGEGGHSGNITITGGEVNVTEDETENQYDLSRGAGIGGGRNGGSGGTITISGGTVNAKGSNDSAAIGGGDGGASGNITISGGTVIAETIRHTSGAAIGGGRGGAVGTITITDNADVTATGSNGAAIGSGREGASGTIMIDGDAKVVASITANEIGAAIGGGGSSSGGTITIGGNANVTATSTNGAAAIGGGGNGSGGRGGNGGIITIEGNATVKATAGTNGKDGAGAAIGGGVRAKSGTITINGGNVKAVSGGHGAGIGGGDGGDCDTITINGGVVNAMGRVGAAIGTGAGCDNTGTITINGGAVVAEALDGGAGIGGGRYSKGGLITIKGGSVIAAANGNPSIGTGQANSNLSTVVFDGGNLRLLDTAVGAKFVDADGNPAYRVFVNGVKFPQGDELTYKVGDKTYSALALYPYGGGTNTLTIYLKVELRGERIEVEHNGVKYEGTLIVNDINTGYVDLSPLDNTAPALSNGTAKRTGEATGTVEFTSDEEGEYYYLVTDAINGEPNAQEVLAAGQKGSCKNGKNSIDLTDLSSSGAKSVYIVAKDAKGNESTVLKVDLAEYDGIAPVLSSGTGTRSSSTDGTVEFTSSETGTYYYIVKDADDLSSVDINDIKAGTSATCNNGPNTLSITDLSSNSAKTVYLVAEDAAGNVSDIQQIGLDAFVPKYNVTITLPDGATFPGDTEITVTVNGKDEKITTGLDGNLAIALPDGNHSIVLSHDGKDYGGPAKVNGADIGVELAEIIPPPPLPPAQPGKGLVFQVGANQGDEIMVYVEGVSAAHLGLSDSSISSRPSASSAITMVNAAINRVSSQRAELGALQNRLEYKQRNLDISAENLSNAESRIRDADMAKEMTDLLKQQILEQSAQVMLSQANAMPQQVLSLLNG